MPAAAVTLAPIPLTVESTAMALAPRAWADTRWVGQVSGHATAPDVLAGAWVSPEARRAVGRAYAAACADLAQATLGGLPPHSADWDRWFMALRTTARELSPARAGHGCATGSAPVMPPSSAIFATCSAKRTRTNCCASEAHVLSTLILVTISSSAVGCSSRGTLRTSSLQPAPKG